MSEASPSMETEGSPAAIAPPAQGAEPAGWPWSRLARPAVIAGETGAIDATAVAAIDHAVTAACDALAAILARPVRVRLSNEAANADAAPQGFGVALASPGLDALVMLDTRAARLLANAIAIDHGGGPGSAAPGPVGELSDVEKGLVEFLTLDALDRALKASHARTNGPVIQSFCDGAAAGLWLQKHQSAAPRTIALELAITGSAGTIHLHMAGLDEVRAAALVGCLSMLDMSVAGLGTVNIMLALPAVALQPEEFAAMQPGDVILLGGPSLTAMPLPGELVTDTHWSLGRAVVAHDTPTYLTVSVSPVQPVARAAALVSEPVVQAMVGLGNETIEKLRGMREGDVLNLAKEPVTPVGLYHGPRKIGAGELIVLGSELGVRIVEMMAT